MAAFQRLQVGMKETTVPATVPNSPIAELMYYLNCICEVLGVEDDPDIDRFRRYKNYKKMPLSDTEKLIALCLLFHPGELLNKCIFQSDEMCGDMRNRFFELSAVKTTLAFTQQIMLGGQQRKVQKIMIFKQVWLEEKFYIPLEELCSYIEQEKAREKEREKEREEQLSSQFARHLQVSYEQETHPRYQMPAPQTRYHEMAPQLRYHEPAPQTRYLEPAPQSRDVETVEAAARRIKYLNKRQQ